MSGKESVSRISDTEKGFVPMSCMHERGRRSAFALAACVVFASWVVVASAVGIENESDPSIVTLPPVGAHSVWVSDRLLAHNQLFDGDKGNALATIDGGTTFTPKPPFFSRRRGEFYGVEIDYSRGRRGDRIDYVTVYDSTTLAVTGEIVFPTRAAESNTSVGYSALFDGDRFLAVTNLFPKASISIIDLEKRRFAGEIDAGGCVGIYPTGERSFATLCASGTALEISFDESGAVTERAESPKFFDSIEDPVMLAGGRVGGERWLWVSFAGVAHEVDFSKSPAEAVAWPLVGDGQRAWRPGGLQHVALHRSLQRLYVLFHEGGPGSHEVAGPEVWVFDLAQRRRVARFAMPILHGGAHAIAVSQDESPLLFARNQELDSVAVLDARTGKHLRDIEEVGIVGPTLVVP